VKKATDFGGRVLSCWADARRGLRERELAVFLTTAFRKLDPLSSEKVQLATALWRSPPPHPTLKKNY